ncbi:MAG: MarR family winged helix-turn-helix transcriptional regulator [Candidatus Thorarchaeota archaeon]
MPENTKEKKEQLREAGFLMLKIRKLSEKIFAKILRDFDVNELTPAQGRVMFPLWQEDDISFQELKRKTLLSKATLSYMLDKLEEAGFIQRVQDANDKRTINIKLLKKDATLQQKFFKVSNEMRNIYYKGFSEEEMDEFENYLRKLLDNLTKYAEKTKEK